MRLLLMLALAAGLPALAGGEWIRLATPHFELYTTAGEKKGREAILKFEQVRNFFMQASPGKAAPGLPVRIIAFRSEKEYRPYRVSEAAAAYYAAGQNRDYIVMEDISPEHYSTAIHEYTHLIIRHTHLELPLWLNEGWADLFSTLQPHGKQAMVGALIPGRVGSLFTERWMDLGTLTAVQHDSPLYNEKARAGMFYAESWALTHMLYFSKEYRPNFTKFVLMLAQGKPAEEAFPAAFGKRMWEVETDLHSYFTRKQLYAALYDIRLQKSEEDPDVSPVAPFDSGLLLADLLAAANKPDVALEAYKQLDAERPGNAEVQRSLGYLAWQKRDQAAARKYFESALAGTTDARMCFDLGTLETDEPKTIEALDRALQLKPDYTEARLQLGLTKLRAHDLQGALRDLTAIKKVEPEQAPALFTGLAYVYAQFGSMDAARENAQSAIKWSKTPDQREGAEQLLKYIEARRAQAASPTVTETPRIERHERADFTATEEVQPRLKQRNPFVEPGEKVERAEGTLTMFECRGARAILHVKASGKTMLFAVDDPTRVQLRHAVAATFEFTCGAQKPMPVAVEYAPAKTVVNGILGVVRALEF